MSQGYNTPPQEGGFYAPPPHPMGGVYAAPQLPPPQAMMYAPLQPPMQPQPQPVFGEVLRATQTLGRGVGTFKFFLAILFSLGLAAFGIWLLVATEKRSQLVDAKISKVTSKSGSKSNAVAATYEFTVGKDTITGVATLRNPGAKVGDVLKVEYNPQNPADNALDTNPQTTGVIVLVIAVFGLLLSFLSYWFSQTSVGSALVGGGAVVGAMRRVF